MIRILNNRFSVLEDTHLDIGRGALSHLTDEGHTIFPAGLTRQIFEAVGGDVDDQRTPPGPWVPFTDGLRDYQQRAVYMAGTRTRIVIDAPTAAGKTAAIFGLVRSCSIRWLVLTPRRHLVDRISSDLARQGIRGVDVWTYAQFVRWGDAEQDGPWEGVICDECHLVGARRTFDTFRFLPLAYYRIGLSATPQGRVDSRNIYVTAALGSTWTMADYETLVDGGWVSPFEIVAISHQTPTIDETLHWSDQYQQVVVDNDPRNNLILNATAKAPKPALLFAQRTSHVRKLADGLRARGVRFRIVQGSTPDVERLTYLRSLQGGSLDVLVSTRVLDTGTDVPALRSVLNAGAGLAPISTVQAAGRGARVSDGKHGFIYVDIEETHGWPLRHWLKRRSALRHIQGRKEKTNEQQ